MKEKLNNTKLNLKNESEDLKKEIEKTNNYLNNLENNFLYLENKIREIVDNQKKINGFDDSCMDNRPLCSKTKE